MAVSEKTSDLLAITEFFAVVDLKSTDNIHSDVAFQKKFHVVHLTSGEKIHQHIK